jgi:hypothetical protein
MRSWASLVLLAVSLAACDLATASAVPAGPPVDCRGIPVGTCQGIVADARTNAGPGAVPVNIRAVCLDAACTNASGNVQVDILYSTGRRDSYTMGWAGPAPGMPEGPGVVLELPVAPVCQGIAPEPCLERARESLPVDEAGALSGGQIVRIVVRCTASSCTDARGDGDTVITFADGTTTTASWSYVNAAGGG